MKIVYISIIYKNEYRLGSTKRHKTDTTVLKKRQHIDELSPKQQNMSQVEK